MKKTYDIAAYIWPAYTGDEPRTRIFWPEGDGEWQTVRNCRPKFEGHTWPRKPLWGYVNEADPYVMQMEIDAAADHGVNVFIYDWYWFDDRPYLEQCLDNGFLKAKNNSRMKFYVMWANHDADQTWDMRNAHKPYSCIWSGRISSAQFRKIADRWVEKYFTHPSYYKIDGKPVFMIYYLNNFVTGVGGPEEAKKCLDYLQERARRAGLPGVHIQIHEMPYDEKSTSPVVGTSAKLLRFLECDSLTHYQFAGHTNVRQEMPLVVREAADSWERIANETGITFFPHISCGWDANPRYLDFRPRIMTENTPENFEKALRVAKAYSDRRNSTPLITVNSWNEWTEGSYLEPDDLNGYAFLDTVKKVFCEE